MYIKMLARCLAQSTLLGIFLLPFSSFPYYIQTPQTLPHCDFSVSLFNIKACQRHWLCFMSALFLSQFLHEAHFPLHWSFPFNSIERKFHHKHSLHP